MTNYLYRWGVLASGIYLLLTGILFWYSTTCAEPFCGLAALLAAMPWIAILDFLNTDIYSLYTSGVFIIILNALILYFVFALLQRWVTRRRT